MSEKRWQFSIRELLLCTLVVAIYIGWCRDKQRANSELKSLGDAVQSQTKEIDSLRLQRDDITRAIEEFRFEGGERRFDYGVEKKNGRLQMKLEPVLISPPVSNP
ncbi:MAG: hypothetical protein HYV60_24695 [Planctomycetia bacterium]|nr:hypothetical protein [Planctomycetia bacterium]